MLSHGLCTAERMGAWRGWLKKPLTSPRPRAVDIRPFICEHSRLTADFNSVGDRKEFEMILVDEWHALLKHYRSKGGLEIRVRRLPGGRHETRPLVCHPCRDERRKDFEEITISLHYLVPDDMDPMTKLPTEACELQHFHILINVNKLTVCGKQSSSKTMMNRKARQDQLPMEQCAAQPAHAVRLAVP